MFRPILQACVLTSVLLLNAGAAKSELCSEFFIPCDNGQCVLRRDWCNGQNTCEDGSDEAYCEKKTWWNGNINGCKDFHFECSDGLCWPQVIRCDGYEDCKDASDEQFCKRESEEDGMESITETPLTTTLSTTITQITTKGLAKELSPDQNSHFLPNASVWLPPAENYKNQRSSIGYFHVPHTAKQNLTAWLLGRKKTENGVNKWGDQLHRTAVALFLYHKGFFSPGNSTGEELAYELTIRMLSYLSSGGSKTFPNAELALYINAMKVACLNPQDFYGHDLVSELRSRVNGANSSNPFEILVLCTAGDVMSKDDVEKTMRAHDSQHRPLWIDNQAVAAMALACLSKRPGLHIDERKIRDMVFELQKRQFRNGTVGNLRTTALVLQATLATNSTEENFDRTAAMRTITQSQKTDGSYGSLIDSYYVLPLFSNGSLADVSSNHCKRSNPIDEEIMASLMKGDDNRIPVYYSIWIKKNVVLGRNWKLMVSPNNTLYDVIETVNRLDASLNVEYSVLEDKPFVSSLSGLQDDPETGMYWFMYTKTHGSATEPKLREQSLVDLRLEANQELIMWYRVAQWHDA